MVRLIILSIMLFFQTNEKRVLALYTTSADNAAYTQQLKILNDDKPGLAIRNIVIQTYIYSDANAAVFNKNKITGFFTVTLTGKDGGEKYRSSQPINLQKLYGIIDAMPMRKQEMKKQ
ncbi:DUF4174 domain-containing protein [Mucilaginibacter sp. RB4R14]|uniref:DUF4174 domain-containing protein n=1 Tax=Mucilaginibacter aurantiaciroseus TaxID=2949308 RepID=UPI002090BB1A|nr:DUF4174 domain-containing protein [Mucilaginibacter aurantiaciroseus]MCO5934367.1 DUF4174 domain-containing protein [Mucilaginibacter aurantiaciroseus]